MLLPLLLLLISTDLGVFSFEFTELVAGDENTDLDGDGVGETAVMLVLLECVTVDAARRRKEDESVEGEGDGERIGGVCLIGEREERSIFGEISPGFRL